MIIDRDNEGIYLSITYDKSQIQKQRQVINSGLLGKTRVSEFEFKNQNGAHFDFYLDYFGNKRNYNNPKARPFEKINNGENKFRIWKY